MARKRLQLQHITITIIVTAGSNSTSSPSPEHKVLGLATRELGVLDPTLILEVLSVLGKEVLRVGREIISKVNLEKFVGGNLALLEAWGLQMRRETQLQYLLGTHVPEEFPEVVSQRVGEGVHQLD